MGFKWSNNIRCTISNGNAVLSQTDMSIMQCRGQCSGCDSFLGVNISMVGERYLDASCSVAGKQQPISGRRNN